MKRYAGIVALLAAVATMVGILAPAAAAEGPIREDLPPIGEFVYPFCGFPVHVEGLQEGEKVLDFGDHIIITGVLKWRLTNLETSTSIDVNLSGAVHGQLTDDGTGFVEKYTGPTIFLLPPGEPLPAGLYLSTGLVVVEGTVEGPLTSITQTGGTWTDLCAALA